MCYSFWVKNFQRQDIFIVRCRLHSLITEKLMRYDSGDQYNMCNSPLHHKAKPLFNLRLFFYPSAISSLNTLFTALFRETKISSIDWHRGVGNGVDSVISRQTCVPIVRSWRRDRKLGKSRRGRERIGDREAADSWRGRLKSRTAYVVKSRGLGESRVANIFVRICGCGGPLLLRHSYHFAEISPVSFQRAYLPAINKRGAALYAVALSHLNRGWIEWNSRKIPAKNGILGCGFPLYRNDSQNLSHTLQSYSAYHKFAGV